MMGDLRDARLIYLKGALFLATGILATALLLYESPAFRTAILLVISIWSFCRAYYFAFYVIEKYVDPTYRFAGLGDFFLYLLGRHKGRSSP
jgi:hypothetical protein